MRIGCLQFAPQVGDIDNNLNRADAVLSKANPEDLDILVLPELAFTGMLRNHSFLLYIALSEQFSVQIPSCRGKTGLGIGNWELGIATLGFIHSSL